jgi:uncharacterized membrane protein
LLTNLPPLIWVHLLATVVALPLGLQQLLGAKGTPGHRRAGLIYIVVMLVALLSALATFRRDTPFLPFHILALVGLVSLIRGMAALRRWLTMRDAAALRVHKIAMGYSWLGLTMAGVSQFASNPRFGIAQQMTTTEFWLVLLGLNLAMYALGSLWIFRSLVRS